MIEIRIITIYLITIIETKKILAGTKSDLRDDNNLIERMLSNRQAPICSRQAKLLQEEIKAKNYLGKHRFKLSFNFIPKNI